MIDHIKEQDELLKKCTTLHNPLIEIFRMSENFQIRTKEVNVEEESNYFLQ